MLSKCHRSVVPSMRQSARAIFQSALTREKLSPIAAWRRGVPGQQSAAPKPIKPAAAAAPVVPDLPSAPKRTMASSAAAPSAPKAAPMQQTENMKKILKGYGDHSFKGVVADKYLKEVGLPAGTIENAKWHLDMAAADKVAQAVMKWATDHGASVFCHWFQPLGASGVRHGMSGQVQNAFFNFQQDGTPMWNLKGKDLIQGETDGSSYPNGGLRATHTAGGYVTIDPTSPMWLRGDTVFIPAGFVTYHGHAIDEKTPLLRSTETLNREGKRLLRLLGYDCPGLQANIGLEQEFFLIPRDAYMKRPDLQMSGRTIMGMDAPRGQEMCDHYMAPPSLGNNPALACMQEVQDQCYKLGIPLKTRHREVAPNQYEFAPYFGSATTQIDQNLMVMQILEEVAGKHGLACLMQEKPFNNVNGSGKHNNWSLITTDGINLLNVKQCNNSTGNADAFPVIMSAITAAVDEYGDLLRMAIASPGNDFRLGACEAPPAIVSTYLGDDLTSFLEGWIAGKSGGYTPNTKGLDLGAPCLASLEIPSEDRNRTSPFPYGGHRFEFRAVGSSQNVSMVNTALNTMTAAKFKEFADAIESGKGSPREVAAKALKHHWKVIFNGNNYDESNQEELTKRGVWRIDSGVEAMCRIADPKNIQLFSSMGVLSTEECAARRDVMLDHYVGSVEIEVKAMISMINHHVIPSVKKAGVGPSVKSLSEAASTLKDAMAIIHAEGDLKKKANMARMLRLEDMIEFRNLCDEAEAVCPAEYWTLATYEDLLFLDQTSQ